MHALIVGPRQVGKSTLIQKVLKDLNHPVWGFATKKETSILDPELGHPIYIYDAVGPRIQTEENLVGYCWDRRPIVYTEVFESFAQKLQTPPKDGSVILMDELGFMESKAENFCSTVLRYLDGDIPIIAAVKDKSTPFLDAVKSHPNCKCFFISEENREELSEEVLAFMKEQF